MVPASEDAGASGFGPVKCPALILALALALGIGAGSSLDNLSVVAWHAASLLIAGTAAGLVAAIVLFRAARAAACAVFVLAGFTLAGATLPILFAHRFPPDHVRLLDTWGIDLDRPVGVEGSVLTEPIVTPSGLEFDLSASRLDQESAVQGRGDSPQSGSRTVSGKIRVRLESFAGVDSGPPADQLFDLHPGDVVETRMLLRRPRVYQNPGSFDFRKRAAEVEDLYWEGSVPEPSGIRRLARPSGFHTSRAVWSVRRRIGRGIDRLYPPWSVQGRDGAVLKAILLGDRSSLDSATVDHFRASGLYHLLVIAGLHVGLIAGLVAGVLRLFGFRRTARNLLLMAVLVAYSLLVEQRAPTLRATLMIVAFVLADLLNRDPAALNSVGLAAIILLASRPAWLFESGFQLSFAAALLIVGLAGPLLRLSVEPYHRALRHLDSIELDDALTARQAQFRIDLRVLTAALRSRFPFLDRRPDAAASLILWPVGTAVRLVEIAVLSAALQIGLLLPMVETFHRVTLIGIGLNSLALPLMAVLLAIAIPTVALATVAPSWAAVPAKLLALVFKALFWLAEMPHLPAWLSYRVPSPPAAVALGFALSLIALALCLGRSRLGAAASTVVFGVFAILLATEPFAPALPSAGLELTALDCGRGRSSFIVLPGGITMLIRAGGTVRAGNAALTARWDPGENIVAPYLWSRRVKNLDVLVAPDSNLDGIAAILDDFHVRELWLGPQTRESVAGELPAIARGLRRGAELRPIVAGELIRLNEATVQLASPPGTSTIDAESSGGLTLRVSAGGAAALWVSAAPSSTRPPVFDSLGTLRSQVLVIDRPGLATLARTDFLGRGGPAVAITSPGRSWREDSAAQHALAGLTLDLRIFGTDSDGAVTATMLDGSIQIRTFRGGIRSARGW
jgi:competence protein ComEC